MPALRISFMHPILNNSRNFWNGWQKSAVLNNYPDEVIFSNTHDATYIERAGEKQADRQTCTKRESEGERYDGSNSTTEMSLGNWWHHWSGMSSKRLFKSNDYRQKANINKYNHDYVSAFYKVIYESIWWFWCHNHSCKVLINNNNRKNNVGCNYLNVIYIPSSVPNILI